MSTNYEVEKNQYLQGIDKTNAAIEKLLEYSHLDLATNAQLDKMREILEKNKQFKHKLESNEFEIAIVGLEKAGKSTFANALIENYVLPSAPERCTFTSTRLVSGSDRAIVEFYNESEFNDIFIEMLKELNYPNATTSHFKSMSVDDFDAFFENLNETNPALYKSHLGKTDEEIRDILKNKNKLTLTGQIKEFSGSQLNTDEFHSYIKGDTIRKPDGKETDTSKPRSVKRIEIESAQLKSMENAIIYDVPGFDSPTQLHMRQTEERLKSADVIILVTNVGRNPSIQGTSLNVITKNTDADGIELKDKLFVFGNQIDLVEREDDLDGNYNILLSDVQKYRLGEKKRVFRGAAKKYLVLDKNIIQDDEYSCKYDILSGIDEIRKALIQYYETERFEILKRKIDSNKTAIKKLFVELHNAHSDNLETNENSEYQKSVIILAERKAIEQRIRHNLKQFMHEKKQEIYRDKWLSQMVIDSIKSGNIFQHIDEETYNKVYINYDEGIREDVSFEKINSMIRKELHLIFLDKYVDLIKQITSYKCTETEQDILLTFTSAVAGNTHYSEQVKNLCSKFIQKSTVDVAHNDQRFTYLIERFSRLVFDIVLEFPIGNNDRMERFKKHQPDVIMLDHYYSKNQGRLTNEMLSQKTGVGNVKINLAQTGSKIMTYGLERIPELKLLNDIFHILPIVGGVKNTNELLEINQTQRANSKESVIQEINQDIDNLMNILIMAVIPAIDLEMAFVNSLDKQVKLILGAAEDNKHKNANLFNEFVSSAILETKKHELENISQYIELQKKKREILTEIQDF